MADQIITELPIKQQSGFNLNSYLLGLDADSYRILISDLAKKIVEDYSGSTLAGSAQAVKTALDSIDLTIGNTAMGTTATTITGAIAEHESDIGSVNEKIGDTAMGTTATTLTGAIAEHESDISTLNSNKLGFQGDFTGNMNSIDISPGIYRLNAAGSYTITDLPGSMSDPAYCLFIQEPYFNTQVILNDSYLLIRKRTGNPPAWRSWLKLPS